MVEKQAQEKPLESQDINQLWLICFTGGEANHWMQRLLTCENFRHCYVIQYQLDVDSWVMLDWKSGVADIIVMKHDDLIHVQNHLLANQGTMVMMKAVVPDKAVHYRFPVMYCVQAILQVLGLPTGWTFTPKQLYKRLMNSGGIELEHYRSDHHG